MRTLCEWSSMQLLSWHERSLFSAAKKLLNQGDNRAVYRPVDDNVKLANQLGTFFVQKIETTGSKLENFV